MLGCVRSSVGVRRDRRDRSIERSGISCIRLRGSAGIASKTIAAIALSPSLSLFLSLLLRIIRIVSCNGAHPFCAPFVSPREITCLAKFSRVSVLRFRFCNFKRVELDRSSKIVLKGETRVVAELKIIRGKFRRIFSG